MPSFDPSAPYLDSSKSVGERVGDLLSRMTLEEKIGQMCQYVGPEHLRQAEARLSARAMRKSDAHGFYPGMTADDVEELARRGLIGSFLHVVSAREANALQRLAAESRLRVPLLIGIDAIHGNALARGATVYPTPIGLAATFDPELAERVASQTALEVRAMGAHWTFSPNVDVARDARWGRVGETFGEDPLLTGEMGAAMTRGYQGADASGPRAIWACAKHMIAGSEPVNGINAAPMDLSERTLRDVFLPPYAACLRAGCRTVMMAHNELNGIPCHAHRRLMEDLLRGEMGFDGFIVSDWLDIERLVTLHHVAENQKDAVFQTVDAGMDMHMHGPDFLEPLLELVAEGRISEERIERSARKILEAKFMLGLFENPFVDEAAAASVFFAAAHRETALEAARKSIVLLKNEGVLPLPLDRPFRLFVTGPNAGNHSPLGDWTLEQPEENVVSVVEGLRRIAPPSCRIDYYDCGASIRSLNGEHVAEAARRAAGADAALIVVGENSLRYQNQEKTCGENIDTSDIGLPGMQLALVQAVRAAGAPAIVALINGRPLAVEWIAENAAALIEAWEPGCFGGLALAEILFGAVNPSGKMPISVPRGAGHIQTIYNHKPSQYFRNYVFGKTGPLYEFGDGLSYAKFEYSDLRLPERVAPGQDVSVRFTIRNAGERAGEEVALVFVRDLVGSVATPVRALKAFRRVALQPGESAAVALAIPFDSLALYDRRMRRVVEPGKFQVFVGGLTGEFEAL